MAYEFDIKAVIKAMPEKILKSAILLIFCINSKFLYNCLIKLAIIQEKQLIINMMSLRHLYD